MPASRTAARQVRHDSSRRKRLVPHAFYQRMGFTEVCDRSGRFLKELA
jgi:hypothetical protein